MRSDLNGKETRMIERIKRRPVRTTLVLCIVLSLVAVTILAASCGGTTTSKKSTSSSTAKLPPGVSSSQATSQAQQSTTATTTPTSTTPTTSSSTSTTTPAASTPSANAELVGARFTVVSATRPNTNQSVISSSARAVPGDYLEVELSIFNDGTEGLVDLSQYSFRLLSPGIAADTYSAYYGTNGTYGAYVDTNEISGTLLDFADLQPVAYKVKVWETIDKVFLFFDLNPLTNAPNAGVTKANTQFIIYKNSGTDYGTQVAIPLAGYPD